MLPIHTILHPTDFSACSREAFRIACSLARDYGGRVIVLHVAAPQVASYAERIFLPPLPEGYLDQARQYLSELRPPDSDIPVAYRLAEGDPATEIVRAVTETRCDLIVMGTHGRTGLGRLLLGSVAEQVHRRTFCPVVTVKTPIAETQPAGAAAARDQPAAVATG
jgi:nucleotide-binding universal stress UspA family protein